MARTRKKPTVINGNLTISRVSCNKEGDYIEIRFTDDDASVEFATAKLSLEQFASCITGRSCIDCQIEVGGLEYVGKKMEHKPFEFELPEIEDRYGRDAMKNAAIAEAREATYGTGWIPDEYYGSQNSFFKKDGKDWARTTLRRWIEKEPE